MGHKIFNLIKEASVSGYFGKVIYINLECHRFFKGNTKELHKTRMNNTSNPRMMGMGDGHTIQNYGLIQKL